MAFLTVKNVSLRLGGALLLDEAAFNIERGDRVCLLGRNGCGKSTLLKLLAGERTPDQGEVACRPALRIAHLPQDVPADMTGTVRAIVQSDAARVPEPDRWRGEQAACEAMTRLSLEADAPFETLSGGLKRRTLLARALAGDPDLLLLDEPTNHLDTDVIEWIEDFLKRRGQTMMFVTHDRVFLRRLATRIFHLDRGRLSGWECDYDTFLQRQQQQSADEAVQWERKGRRLSKEEAWIRQGIKARRTRDEGRVRALQALREDFRQRRHALGTSRVNLLAAERSGTLVVKAEDVAFAYPGSAPIVRHLDLRILRGERIGIVGPNGSGKTTLLKLIVGELAPLAGTLKLGTRLDIAYFDQLRATLDDEKSLVQNLAGDGDFIDVGGQRRHVYGYLQDFLFEPARARMPVKALSGGERHRLLLARLFMKPCNLLIMDEPTNDLDMETLDLLEEQLQRHAQTLLLVSHDRAFLNHIATRTLALEGGGRVGDYAGGYDDWLAQRPARVAPAAASAPPPRPKRPARRAGHMEKKELAAIGRKIEALEQEQARLTAAQCEADFYKKPSADIVKAQSRATAVAAQIEQMYERWAELEERVEEARAPR